MKNGVLHAERIFLLLTERRLRISLPTEDLLNRKEYNYQRVIDFAILKCS
ncbi:MAG: hypothetical protein A4E57_03147 [Syntrophorhabdaceae bacterium PtaU1.Bin034]|nr:MAG: hypothetical protein A4E57_03147 [Syntrophorhabdaceae bacterium PtaU1.Bin034]